MTTPIQRAVEAVHSGFPDSDRGFARAIFESIDRDELARAIITAPVDWEGRDTGTWDRGAQVADAILEWLTQ